MTRIESTNLKFCLFNAENLFLLFDTLPEKESLTALTESQWQRLSTSIYENKSLKKSFDIARALKEIDADIIMFCEVGGFESLKNFNYFFMDDAYSVHLIEGNSNRNIDVGFLVRKGLPLQVDLQSNRHRPINFLYPHEKLSLDNNYPVKDGKVFSSHGFSRDASALTLYQEAKEDPSLIILLAHLKSRLDPERIDPYGFERRQAELRTLLEIYGEQRVLHPNLPIIIAGDFNGNAAKANTDEEFKDIYTQTELLDVLEVAQVTPENRATYYQVRNSSRADGRQIDFCFISPELQNLLKLDTASVYRFKNEMGVAFDIPRNMDAKNNLPSDHYPVVFEIENLKIL